MREDVIVVTSNIGIVVNLFMAAVKIVLGVLASSIAIMSEGANNATDALSSVLTLIGTKLAGKHPDKKHPFGYRRVEYLTGLSELIFVEISCGKYRFVCAILFMAIEFLSLGLVW